MYDLYLTVSRVVCVSFLQFQQGRKKKHGCIRTSCQNMYICVDVCVDDIHVVGWHSTTWISKFLSTHLMPALIGKAAVADQSLWENSFLMGKNVVLWVRTNVNIIFLLLWFIIIVFSVSHFLSFCERINLLMHSLLNRNLFKNIHIMSHPFVILAHLVPNLPDLRNNISGEPISIEAVTNQHKSLFGQSEPSI